MGRMRNLRAIELTKAEAAKDAQEFGLGQYLSDKYADEKA